MKEAVIVSTARTPIGKAYRGAFNATQGPTLASFAIREAVKRAGVDPAEIDDVIMGNALTQGSTNLYFTNTRAGLLIDSSNEYMSNYISNNSNDIINQIYQTSNHNHQYIISIDSNMSNFVLDAIDKNQNISNYISYVK